MGKPFMKITEATLQRYCGSIINSDGKEFILLLGRLSEFTRDGEWITLYEDEGEDKNTSENRSKLAEAVVGAWDQHNLHEYAVTQLISEYEDDAESFHVDWAHFFGKGEEE